MHIVVRSTGGQTLNNVRQIEDIISGQLSRFQHRVRNIQLFIEDVNGPRGGIDKQCRFILHVRNAAPIVIRDSDHSIAAMVRRVAGRASHTLSRYLNRRSRPKSRRIAPERSELTSNDQEE